VEDVDGFRGRECDRRRLGSRNRLDARRRTHVE
jgi:hypothetical protein